MPAILFLFSLTNLVIGTGAYVLTGILRPLADSLHVSVAAAGQAMTAHALATAGLAPLILLATGSWPRKRAILMALAMFAAGAAVCASAQSLTVLLLGRVLMGAGTVFTAAVAGVTVAIVAPEKRGKALALTFLGMSLSYALGVPLGAWLGLTYGWRVPVWLVAGACVAVAALLAVVLPQRIEAPGAGFTGLGAAARQGFVLRVQLLLLASMMVLVPFTQGHPMLTVLVFMLWGLAGFGMLAPQQVMLTTRVPHQAALLMNLNGSMLYLGSSVGAIVGGSLIQTLGFERLSWVGLPFALLALATLWFDTHRHPHGARAV